MLTDSTLFNYVLRSLQKTAVACEHQKAFILCPNIFNGIDIVSAMFGRKNHLECLAPGEIPASFCTDQEDQIKQQVKDLCQGEDKCEVSASNDFLAMEGTQICPQVRIVRSHVFFPQKPRRLMWLLRIYAHTSLTICVYLTGFKVPGNKISMCPKR